MKRRDCLAGVAALGLTQSQNPPELLPRDDGYRGIWYMNQPSQDQYRYKYSGGFATYPQQHLPIAWHVPAARKTFFVYGGVKAGLTGQSELHHLVSYLDHATGEVPRPAVLLNKKTTDAHDNPTLCVDPEGYLWVFSNSHGTGRPSFIHRSRRPHSIDAFDRIWTGNFSYGQPWHLADRGFLFLHTRYSPGRFLHWMGSQDGRNWSEPKLLARVAQGHYQVSWRHGNVLATAFDYHPNPGGLNARTNLYFLQTRDGGRSWTTVDGRPVSTPLTEVKNPALVRDFQAEGLLVYLKDLQFDSQGRPVILFLTSKGYASGPENGPRLWQTARWTGQGWDFRVVTESDHNYDHGSLYLEPDGRWQIIAPFSPGAQPFCTGGDLESWVSRDQGRKWEKHRVLTASRSRNHTYVRRPVDAHPDFYGFWADGNALQPSSSSLYFTNRDVSAIWRLPTTMTGEFARPERLELPAT